MFQVKIYYDTVHYNQILCVNKNSTGVSSGIFSFLPAFPLPQDPYLRKTLQF